MAAAQPFEIASDTLEHASTLDRLESRGTLRLALKAAGYDPKTVGPSELAVVVERLLPKELAARGIADVEAVVERIVTRVTQMSEATGADSPEDVFKRLGGEG